MRQAAGDTSKSILISCTRKNYKKIEDIVVKISLKYSLNNNNIKQKTKLFFFHTLLN